MLSKKQTVKIAGIGIFLLLLLFSAFAPAAAVQLANPGPAQDVTLVPNPDITVVVPDTGDNAEAPAPAGFSWVLWVLLFVIVLALIIGLVARPRSL